MTALRYSVLSSLVLTNPAGNARKTRFLSGFSISHGGILSLWLTRRAVRRDFARRTDDGSPLFRPLFVRPYESRRERQKQQPLYEGGCCFWCSACRTEIIRTGSRAADFRLNRVMRFISQPMIGWRGTARTSEQKIFG